MKKLFIIPVLLLVAALFITCDIQGDWSDIVCPLIPDGSTHLVYTSNNGWVAAIKGTKIDGNSFKFADADGTAASYSASGCTKLMLVFTAEADFGWWSGSGGVTDSDDANSGWHGGNPAYNYKGFWVFPLSLSGINVTKVNGFEVQGSGPGSSDNKPFLTAAWFE